MSSNRLSTDYTMVNPTNASNEDLSITSSHSEQRTTVLSALARIIAKTYLNRTAADKKDSMGMTPPNKPELLYQ